MNNRRTISQAQQLFLAEQEAQNHQQQVICDSWFDVFKYNFSSDVRLSENPQRKTSDLKRLGQDFGLMKNINSTTLGPSWKESSLRPPLPVREVQWHCSVTFHLPELNCSCQVSILRDQDGKIGLQFQKSEEANGQYFIIGIMPRVGSFKANVTFTERIFN